MLCGGGYQLPPPPPPPPPPEKPPPPLNAEPPPKPVSREKLAELGGVTPEAIEVFSALRLSINKVGSHPLAPYQ